MHSETRKKGLVDMLHRCGVGISYTRVLGITTDFANATCERFEAEGVVCPSNMVPDKFTIGAVDNIDHNPSSRTASESFHGTSISLKQPQAGGSDNASATPSLPEKKESVNGLVLPLPAVYTIVPPLAMPHKDVFVPKSDALSEIQIHQHSLEKICEMDWLHNCQAEISTPTHRPNAVSWSAFHASRQSDNISTSNNGMLPLLIENAHSSAMIKHA